MVAAALQVAIPHGECIVAIMYAYKNATSHLLLLPMHTLMVCGVVVTLLSCSPYIQQLADEAYCWQYIYSSWHLINYVVIK